MNWAPGDLFVVHKCSAIYAKNVGRTGDTELHARELLMVVAAYGIRKCKRNVALLHMRTNTLVWSPGYRWFKKA